MKPNKLVINVTSTLNEETGKVHVNFVDELECTGAMLAGTMNAILEHFEEKYRDEWIIALTKFLKDRGFDQ